VRLIRRRRQLALVFEIVHSDIHELNWLAILVLGKFMLKLEISFRGG
jgi:hypothetical protein